MSAPLAPYLRQRGVTLVELVVSMVVIALAGLALVGTLGFISSRSGDSITELQAQSMADAYLAREIAQPFASVAGSTSTDGTFSVSVAVANSAALTFVPAAAAKRVDVTITSATGLQASATGYRLSY